MNGLATSRQSISAKQRLSQGSRTQNARTIAPHVLKETVSLVASEANKGPVQFRRANKTFTAGELIVHQGEFFHFVASSTFERRFYVVVADVRSSEREPIVYHCSASDERVVKKCINAVKATREVRDYFAA